MSTKYLKKRSDRVQDAIQLVVYGRRRAFMPVADDGKGQFFAIGSCDVASIGTNALHRARFDVHTHTWRKGMKQALGSTTFARYRKRPLEIIEKRLVGHSRKVAAEEVRCHLIAAR